MSPDTKKMAAFLLNIASAVAAFTAALLWYLSTRVEVEHVEPSADENGLIGGSLSIQGSNGRLVDPFATGMKQARWNRWAAGAASVAAVCQGFATLLT
ncbi:hypothetical protein [Burkholderia seminalis]|uniref:hypothetical protein n=1 Tax=Burkholderia seminalis TaxID=488731 RepID=UPI00190587D3|nr:hypothetical protein [Burkholderia seminalis]MBJ9594163.1 hypothetical protein [Burkholderia seminalis]